MHNLTRTALAVAAGAAVASVGGVIAVSAATSTTQPKPAASGVHGLHRGWRHLPRMVGLITSETSSGGVLGKGQITVMAPDGKSLTLSLTPGTKIWRYHGPGERPTVEALSALSTNEVVVVTGRGLFSSRHLARHILDLGISGTISS
jgi:outer membrane protein assembly factor BamB